MKRFVFHLQRVLDLRCRREQEAQRCLARLNRSRSEIEDRLREAESARRAVLVTWRSELVGALAIGDLRLQATLARQQDRHARQLVLELAALEPQLEAARGSLKKATADRRVMEHLRQCARQRWHRTWRRRSRRDEAEQALIGRSLA